MTQRPPQHDAVLADTDAAKARDGNQVDSDRSRSAALRQEADAWAVRLKIGQPSRDDLQKFEQWYGRSALHAQAWAMTARDWRTVETAAMAAQRQRPLQRNAAGKRHMTRRMMLGGAVSAFGSLVAAGIWHPPFGLWPSWQEWHADYRTATGEQRRIALTQHLALSLNTQTSITVQRQGDMPKVALLAGEAVVATEDALCEFQVDAGRLVMRNAEIEARRYAGARVRVACLRGAAQLHHPSGIIELRTGQQIAYDQAQMTSVTPLGKASTWRDGVVTFDDLPLTDAIEEINRYRSGRVLLMNEAIGQRRFSARFKIQELDAAIDLLQAAHGVRVRRLGDVVFLS